MSSHIFQEVSVHLLAVTPTRHLLERMDLAAPVLAPALRASFGAMHYEYQDTKGIARARQDTLACCRV